MERYKAEIARLEKSYKVWYRLGMSMVTISLVGLAVFSFFLIQT